MTEQNQNKSELLKLESIFKDIKNKALEITPISIEKILQKICVSPPYFTFTEIYHYDNYLIAPVNPQQITGLEDTPISIGECGRHMAILASCTEGFISDEKKFYLVENAKIHSNQNLNIINNVDCNPLYIIAKLTNSDKRILNAETAIFDKEYNHLYSMSVSFKKLSVPLFKKFFSNKLEENFFNPKIHKNPYLEYFPLKLSKVDKKYFEYILEDIPKEMCLGHFDECPAIPTAFLVYNIMHFASNKYLEIFGGSKYKIISAELKLEDLIFYKENKVIQIYYEIIEDNSKRIFFDVKINYNNNFKNHIKFSIITND